MRVIAIFGLLLVACARYSAAAASGASMAALPGEVQQALLSLCTPCTFADFDAPWNTSDVLNGLPQRHLVKVEQLGPKWLIQYDHGGYAPHTHTVVFAIKPSPHIVEGSSCLPSREKKCEW